MITKRATAVVAVMLMASGAAAVTSATAEAAPSTGGNYAVGDRFTAGFVPRGTHCRVTYVNTDNIGGLTKGLTVLAIGCRAAGVEGSQVVWAWADGRFEVFGPALPAVPGSRQP